MVSYRQLDQHGIKQVVLHERETSSSGRPKAQSLQGEDADFFYEYDSRGGLKSKRPKLELEKYQYWWKNNVKIVDGIRQTPLIEFEKQMKVKMTIPSFRYRWCLGYTSDGHTYGCQEKMFTEKEFGIFMQTHTIDYGELETYYTADIPAFSSSSNIGNRDWVGYFRQKASEQNLEIVGDLTSLNFREKQKPAVVEKTRPNPKEVEKVEPVEIEPIKEVVKYSPLMIAGVIAVVVILLLKRRRA